MAKGLPPPTGSPPGKPGKYAFYITRHGDDDTQCIVLIYASAYASRKMLDELLQDDGYVWDDECTIRSETGIIVSTRWWPDRMKRAVDHELTLQEMAWSFKDSLPDDYRAVRRFREGPELPRTLEELPEKRTRSGRAPSAPRADAPRGYVHVSDVAEQMGIDAKLARRGLRKLFESKPAYGWYFDPATLDDLKTKIKEAIE